MKITPFYTWSRIAANNVHRRQLRDAGSGRRQSQPRRGVSVHQGRLHAQRSLGQLAFTYTNSKSCSRTCRSRPRHHPQSAHRAQRGHLAVQLADQAGGGHPATRTERAFRAALATARSRRFRYDPQPVLQSAVQGLLNLGGWYNPYSTAIAPSLNGSFVSYISPYVSSLILNWRHDKLAITPSFSFQSGGFYGTPLDNNGVDPRSSS